MSGTRPDPAVALRAPGARPTGWDDDDVTALGQTVAGRLFTAGLDLHFALMLIGDGPAAQRCNRAVDEIDQAIRQVRHLVLAVHERDGDGHGPVGDIHTPYPGDGWHQ